jgi:hypothetical protein
MNQTHYNLFVLLIKRSFNEHENKPFIYTIQTLRRLFFKVACISLPAGFSGEALSIGNGFSGEAPDHPKKLLIKRSFNEQPYFLSFFLTFVSLFQLEMSGVI